MCDIEVIWCARVEEMPTGKCAVCGADMFSMFHVQK